MRAQSRLVATAFTCLVSTVALAGLPEAPTTPFDLLDHARLAPGPGDQGLPLGASVDLFRGSLSVQHASSPGLALEGFVLGLGRNYDSQRVRMDVLGGGERYLHGRGSLGLGWSSHLGRIFIRPGTGQRYYEFPGGSLHQFVPWATDAGPSPSMAYDPGIEHCAPSCEEFPELANCGTCFYVPGTDFYTVTFPDGSAHEFRKRVFEQQVAGYTTNADHAGFYTTKMTDRFGHVVHVVYWPVTQEAQFPAIQRVWSPDVPGVEITTTLCESADVPQRCPVTGLLKEVLAPGFQGDRPAPQSVVYAFYYDVVEVADDSAAAQPLVVPLLTEVHLPAVDGAPAGVLRYSYGEDPSLEPGVHEHGPLLTRIESPTGAVAEFRWGTWVAGHRVVEGNTTDREQVGVDQVTVFPDGFGTPPVPATASRYSWAWEREYSLPTCASTETARESEYVTTLPDGRTNSATYRGHPCGDDTAGWGVPGTVKTSVVHDAPGSTTPLRTTAIDWNEETEPPDDEQVRPMAGGTTTTFHDDVGTCFGATVGGPARTMTTAFRQRNAWGQWRMALTTGDYLREDWRRLTYTNLYSPDNDDAFSCAPTDTLVGLFDYRFVEEGPVSFPASGQRYEERFDFDCDGRMLETRTKDEWGTPSTVLGPTDAEDAITPVAADDGDDPTVSHVYGSAHGQPLSSSLTGGDTSTTYTTSFTWSRGQLLTATPPLPAGVSYLSVDNTLDSSGMVQSSQDPNGLVSRADYDALGRPLTVETIGTGDHATRYVYPSLKETRVIVSPGTETAFSGSDAQQIYAAQWTDGLGRVVETEQALQDGTLSVSVARYDPFGRTIFVSVPMRREDYDPEAGLTWQTADGAYGVSGIPTAAGRPLGTLYFYGVPDSLDPLNPLKVTPDGLGRVRRVEQADGSAVDYEYCGPHVKTSVGGVRTQIAGAIDETAATIEYRDGFGRVVLVDAPGASADAQYTHDLRGNLVRVDLLDQLPSDPFEAWRQDLVTPGAAQVRTFEFDAAGRMRSSATPETGPHESLTFDAAGNVLTWTDNLAQLRGYSFKNTFDAAGRLTRVERVTPSPPLGGLDRIGSRGNFEQSSDLSSIEAPGVWVEGTITGSTFAPGETTWKQAGYGGCLAPPPGTGNTGVLYFGDVCTYGNATAGIEALRFAIAGARREDALSLKFWRQLREGAGVRDEFSVFVTLQAAGADTSAKRELLRLNEGQASLATWQKTDRQRLSDVFSATEWPEGQTRDLFVYLAFEKKDTAATGLGTGLLIDDVAIGRKAFETLAEYEYDQDVCADVFAPGGTGGAACGGTIVNHFLGRASRVLSYQGGRLAGAQSFVYKGPGGRLSALAETIDWAGVGEFATFVQRATYDAFGRPVSMVAPYQPEIDEPRVYAASYWKGFLDGLGEVDGPSFLPAGASPPSIEYGPASLNILRLGSGTQQEFEHDPLHRLERITVTGPEPLGAPPATVTLWDTGPITYDGSGRIKQIGEQEFSYDLAGRLHEAHVLPQASAVGETNAHEVTYEHDRYGNMTSRVWEKENEPSAIPPAGMEFTETYGPAGEPANQPQSDAHAFDANGNQTRMPGGFSPAMSATWDAQNRMTSLALGSPEEPIGHRVLDRYLYDSAGFRLVRYPEGGDGLPVVTLRDGAGQAIAEYVYNRASARLELSRDFIYGLGRLLVEREVVQTQPVVIPNATFLQNGSYTFSIVQGGGAESYSADIRTASGYTRQVTGLTPVSGKVSLPESDFALGEVNFLRIRREGEGAAVYSAPVTVVIDPEVDAESTNQVRVLAIGRVGNQVRISFAQFQANGLKTYIYFRRADNQQLTLQTPPAGLPAGQTSYTLDSQALAVPCGEVITVQGGAESMGSVLAGVDVANITASGAGCTPPEPAAYLFADLYHHRDHLGSLRVVTDAAGWLVEGQDYYPFGMPQGTGSESSAHQYTGHERDALTDADYMKMRYKLASAARFASPDPLLPVSMSNPSSWNRYAYVGSDPVNFVDPMGMAPGGHGPYYQAPSPWADGPGYSGGGGGGVSCVSYWTSVTEEVSTWASNVPGSGSPSPTVYWTLHIVCFTNPEIEEPYLPTGPGNPNEQISTQTEGEPNTPEALDPKENCRASKCIEECSLEQFGLQTIAGGTLIVSSLPVLPTPGKFLGATPNTSILSRGLSWLFPQKIPRTWAPTFKHMTSASSNVAGRVAGRWIPWIGPGILISDVAGIGACTWQCASCGQD